MISNFERDGPPYLWLKRHILRNMSARCQSFGLPISGCDSIKERVTKGKQRAVIAYSNEWYKHGFAL